MLDRQFPEKKQSTGKCRSLHLVVSTQSVFSSSPDPFRRTKEPPPAGCILSRHFRVTNVHKSQDRSHVQRASAPALASSGCSGHP